jgi:predicted NBD/HSP70 family sugar kinase
MSVGKVSNQSLRQVNRSLLLDMIRTADRLSRSELARRSGLTKPTVSAIVDDLIAEGVVSEVGFAGTLAAGGRPARLLEFNIDSAAYLGLEFGVESTNVAVADGRGEIRHVARAPAVLRDPERTLGDLPQLVARALKEAHVPRARVQAVGATVPGLVEQSTGICRLAPNLGWRNYALRDAVSRALKRPAAVLNITQAAAIAEARIGAARGSESFIWMYLGSGVGAGIISKGSAFVGTRGFAGEIGHCRISDEDVRCGCGKKGHLEAFVSSSALLRAATLAARQHPRGQLAKRAPFETLAPLVSAVEDGDAQAHDIVRRAGEHIGIGVAYLVNILDAHLVVLGGPVAALGNPLVEAVQRASTDHALSADGVRVVQSSLGEQATLIGAVLLAMDQAVRSYRVVAARVGPDGSP